MEIQAEQSPIQLSHKISLLNFNKLNETDFTLFAIITELTINGFSNEWEIHPELLFPRIP